MDLSLRLKLSVMMFLEYFVWGTWGVVIFTYVSQLPTAGGLNLPGSLVGWIGATLPIGAMISPIFIGLFTDRFFATERVLAALHLVGAGLIAWAAWTCDQNQPQVKTAFQTAATAERVGDGNVLQALEREQALKNQLAKAPEAEKAGVKKELDELQKQLEPAVKSVNDKPEVRAAISSAFWPLFGLLIAYAVCYMPTLTLTNTLSFRNMSDPDRYFGGIRVLGTIGWIVAGLLVGFGLNSVSTQPLYLAAGSSVLFAMFCLFLPHTPPAGKAQTLADSLGLPAFAMLKAPSYLVFIVCTFLINIVLAFYYQQANPFLFYLEVPYPAAVQTLGQISEIFFMLLIPVGLARLGTKGMLLLGMLAWVVRFAIFATLNVPLVVAIGLPLHGICYDFFFVVAYLYVDRQAPADLRGAAQGFITFVALGAGWFVGNLVSGAVVQLFTDGKSVAWPQVWLVPMVGSAAAMLVFGLLFRGAGADRREAAGDKAAG